MRDRRWIARTEPDAESVPRALMSRVSYLLNRTAHQIRKMAQQALHPMGLIPPGLAILSTLSEAGPLTQRALGRTLRIDPTTIVWMIDDLEKKGLVRRGRHPKDRRAYLVELTSTGKSTYQQAFKCLVRLEDKFLTPLSAGERAALKELLVKLYQGVTTQRVPRNLFTKHGGTDS